MSSIIALGTFERVPLRNAWPTEDGNFTPWLAEPTNVSLLAEALDIELEVEAGIPPAKALQIATINAARVLKQEAELGSIAPGKRADLLLVEGNPSEHISDIRRCRMVLKNGTVYDSTAVYAAAGIKPAD